ncbi:MAG TPA: hypothetical protein VMU88_08115 [bacterium]|nr:hypothetical protein [bacterium]
MRLFSRILGIGLILALVYFLLVGLGLTHLFKGHKQLKKILVLNDFEYPDTDLDWTTGGYVNVESSTDNLTHGKRSAKASYLLSSQFKTEPTAVPTEPPAPAPTVAAPVKAAKGKAKKGRAAAPTPTPLPENTPVPVAMATPNWLPGMVLSTDSVTKIPLVDWTGFTTLNVDAFNPQDRPVTYHLEVADGRAFQYKSSGVLTPKKVTNVSVNLDDIAQARLDLSAIRSLSLAVECQGNSLPVVVYWDYLRLEQVPTAAPKK